MSVMDQILNDICPDDDLVRFEKTYNREKKEGFVTLKTQFEYSFCLVRSRFPADIKRGINLLEDLCSKNAEDKRDYIFYLAFGHTRLKEYQRALKYCQAFLQIEPNNQQVIALEEHCKKQIERDGMIGLAAAGAGALVLGGLVGLGMHLASRK